MGAADLKAARVAELETRLAEARARAASADRRLAAAELAYAATGDGIAESLRAIELSADRAQRRRLLRKHVAAEDAAAVEHQTRTARWGTNVIGVPQPLPVGDPPAAAAQILRLGVLGYYRIDAATGTQKVTLFVIPTSPDEPRRRRYLTRPAEHHCFTITDTIRTLIDSAPNRLDALVGANAATTLTALLTHPDDERSRP